MEGRSISQGATFHCLLGDGVTTRRPAVLIALHSERVMEQISTGRSISGIVLELPRTVGEGDSVALGGTSEDVMRPLTRGLSCRREEAGILGLPNRDETGIVDVDADEVAHEDADGLARSQHSLPVGVIMVPGVCTTFVGPSRGLEAVAAGCAVNTDRHEHILWGVLLEPESKPVHSRIICVIRGNVQSLEAATQ